MDHELTKLQMFEEDGTSLGLFGLYNDCSIYLGPSVNTAYNLRQGDHKVNMPEFHFMESEWGVHAVRGGKITTVGAGACMILGFIFSYYWGAVWALFVGLFLATFETPFVYRCFEACRRLEDILNDQLMFRMPAVRAVIYVGLAIVSYLIGNFQIALGILLTLTALLYIFAQIVNAPLKDTSNQPSTDGPSEGETRFGTFT